MGLTLSHCGLLGDLIYGLPACRAAAEITGEPVRLILWPGHGSHQWTPDNVRDAFDNLSPLLAKQPYLSAKTWEQSPLSNDPAHDLAPHPGREHINLSAFRAVYRPGENLARQQCRMVRAALGQDDGQIDKFWPWDSRPWLTDIRPCPASRVVLHRSISEPPRHQPHFPWHAIRRRYWWDLTMVGSEAEYDAWSEEFDGIGYVKTDNLLDLAELIAGAQLFIGNQSCPLAIANGLGIPTIQERFLPDANCLFNREDSLVYDVGRDAIIRESEIGLPADTAHTRVESVPETLPRLTHVTLVSASTQLFWPLFAVTSPGKLQYALQWGHACRLERHSRHIGRPGDHYGERPNLILEVLCGDWGGPASAETDQWVWFSGADLAITNFTIDIARICRRHIAADVVIAEDHYGINNDSVLFHRTPACKQFLIEMIKGVRVYQDDNCATATLLKKMGDSGRLVVNRVDQRVFNSYDMLEYHRQGDPGQWQPGDLAFQAPGIPLKRRIELVKEKLEMVVR